MKEYLVVYEVIDRDSVELREKSFVFEQDDDGTDTSARELTVIANAAEVGGWNIRSISVEGCSYGAE